MAKTSAARPLVSFPSPPLVAVGVFFVAFLLAPQKAAAPLGTKAAAAKSAPLRGASQRAAAVPPGCVLVAATNDVHGALAPYTVTSGDLRGAVSEGGVLALSGYVSNLRAAAKGRLLLLDAGDVFQGTMASNLSFGKAMVQTYNATGYDACAIGNHEFDYGTGGRTEADADKLGVLKARIAEANFPFLTCNIDSGGKAIDWPNVRPSMLKEVGGVKVGIVGASTPSTKEGTNPRFVASLDFAAPAARIAAEAANLRAAGAELVVLLAHMGGRCGGTFPSDDTRQCVRNDNVDGELLRVLAAMPTGTVDVAVGAHTHNLMANWFDETAVIESGAQGHYLGSVLACVRPRGQTQVDASATPARQFDRARSTIYAPQPLCLTTWKDGRCNARQRGSKTQPASFMGRRVQVERNVAQAARPFLEAVDARERQSIGAVLPKALTPSEITALIAEALRRATHADFGVQNRGGVRTSIAAGATTYRQVFEAVPFDNFATVLTLRGHELTALARALVGERGPELYPAFSGLTFSGRGASLRLRTDKGAPIDDNATYTLCTTDFILNGGDGAGVALAGLGPERAQISELAMRDALVVLLRQLYAHPIAAAP